MSTGRLVAMTGLMAARRIYGIFGDMHYTIIIVVC